jgi:hypothetical protein
MRFYTHRKTNGTYETQTSDYYDKISYGETIYDGGISHELPAADILTQLTLFWKIIEKDTMHCCADCGKIENIQTMFYVPHCGASPQKLVCYKCDDNYGE